MIVGHLDLDAFFAAVEELEDPSLRTKPLIVGGDPHGRGVVATANYEARKFGIGSAMSCAEALRRCPQAVFVRPRHSVYREYSATVWEAVREVVPTVERTGLDEGYLDLGEIAESFGEVRALAEAVQTSVRGATSLSAAIGVATSKVVAKIASDRRKPGGLTIVPPGREASFLAPFDVRRLPGVGPRSEARLRRGERLFVMWSGLKGAVPILLAAFALLEHVDGAERIYGIVFVLVTFSVLVQGATIPYVAGRLGIPMRSEAAG